MYHYPIMEILTRFWLKCCDYIMYICYWHPDNHRMWFEISRDKPVTFNTKEIIKREKEVRKYIREHGNKRTVWIDYYLGYLRMISILIAEIALFTILFIWRNL